jgi:hypothetical protein
MWWNEKQWDRFWERFTELGREVSLLWTLFAVLDRVVAESLTFRWAITNVGIGVAGWALSVYLELKRMRE